MPDQAGQLNETSPPEQRKKFSMVPSMGYGCIMRASLDVQGAYAHVIKQYIWQVNDI